MPATALTLPIGSAAADAVTTTQCLNIDGIPTQVQQQTAEALARSAEALAALPKSARTLVDAMDGAGWRWNVTWWVSGPTDAPTTAESRVVAEIHGTHAPSDEARAEIQAYWSTGPKQGPRMSSLITRAYGFPGVANHQWHDRTVKAAIDVVDASTITLDVQEAPQ